MPNQNFATLMPTALYIDATNFTLDLTLDPASNHYLVDAITSTDPDFGSNISASDDLGAEPVIEWRVTDLGAAGPDGQGNICVRVNGTTVTGDDIDHLTGPYTTIVASPTTTQANFDVDYVATGVSESRFCEESSGSTLILMPKPKEEAPEQGLVLPPQAPEQARERISELSRLGPWSGTLASKEPGTRDPSPREAELGESEAREAELADTETLEPEPITVRERAVEAV